MAQLLEYKCPNCGGAIAFDSTLQKMKCPYCDSEFDVSQLKNGASQVNAADVDEADINGEWQDGEADGIREYVCNSCGGVIVADQNTAATSCPYCDNPVVMTGKLSGMLRPDIIIPFKLDKNAAKAALKKHVSKRWLAPKKFKNKDHIDEIKGVYVPFWLFNSDAYGDITYKATKIRKWSDSKYDYTETSHFHVERSGGVSFAAIPVDGSSKMDDALMESIEPFNLQEAVDFNTAYLAGYLADKYDVNKKMSEDRARKRIVNSVDQLIRGTVNGYTTVNAERSNISANNLNAKYALYPVWILNTTYEDKKYTFAMNGQTGRLVGNIPMDKGAYWRWFALFAPVLSGAVYIIMWLLHNLL